MQCNATENNKSANKNVLLLLLLSLKMKMKMMFHRCCFHFSVKYLRLLPLRRLMRLLIFHIPQCELLTPFICIRISSFAKGYAHAYRVGSDSKESPTILNIQYLPCCYVCKSLNLGYKSNTHCVICILMVELMYIHSFTHSFKLIHITN